jgi:hypothetical protein
MIRNTKMGLKIDNNAQVREKIRQKNIRDYFLQYSQAVRPWLIELAEKYKAKGEFPLMPIQILPSYYTDVRDKEIAAFVALLIPETDNVLKNIGEFRLMLGESPWEWFKNRGFVRLGIGKVQDKRTGGVFNWKIAKMMDRLWGEGCGITATYTAFGQAIKKFAERHRCSYFDVQTYIFEDCGVGYYEYKLRLFLLILSTSDGFGLGLWSVDQSELKCPHTSDLRTFVSTWFPDYRRFGSIDDAIHEFGFERDCDFFYCYLGYKELQKRNPKACSEFATTYLKWYEIAARKKPFQFREILLPIEF